LRSTHPANLVGACVIASWSCGLIRDAGEAEQGAEHPGNHVAGGFLWRGGAGCSMFVRMDPTPSAPELADASPPLGFPENVTAEQVAMLDELVGIAMRAARTADRKIVASGQTDGPEMKGLAAVVVAAERAMALRNKLIADGKMTAAELAAAKARRDAGLARRDAARAVSLLRTRKQAMGDALEALVEADAAERGTPPADTVRLVAAARGRVLDADIDRALGAEDYSAIILGICKDLGITPRREIWSHRMMQLEIAAVAEKLRRFEAGLKPPAVPTASRLPPTAAGLGNGPGPGGSYPKIGPFNFDETGAVASVDPPDEPRPTWKARRRWRLDSG